MAHAHCMLAESTNTYLGYVISIAFPPQEGCTNAPHCCVIYVLPVFLWMYSTGARIGPAVSLPETLNCASL
jgi:hypothetical protein